MRILLVEDEEEVAHSLVRRLKDRLLGAQVVLAEDLESAVAALAADSFDLAIFDLQIPSSPGAGDESVDHGRALYAHHRQNYPGTPVMFFSGRGNVKTMKPLLLEQAKADIFGSEEEYPLLEYFEKEDLPELLTRIGEFASQMDELRDVEIATGGQPLKLSEYEQRVLCIFARRCGGDNAMARVEPLSPGLSVARVFKVKVERANGEHAALVVAKTAVLERIADELQRYRTHIERPLGMGAYTPLKDHVLAGAGPTGGLFYTLASDYESTLFQMLSSKPAEVAESVEQLRRSLKDMCEGAPVSTVRIGGIRRLLLSDGDLGALPVDPLSLLDFDWRALEDRDVNVRLCSQHGDLHGANVLVTTDGTPVVIDFGSALRAPAALDPVTLELSLLFHPDVLELRAGWADADRASNWTDISRYADDSKRAFIEACRAWAFSAAAGDREVYACVYAYAVRQLNFSDTDHEVAAALAAAAARALTP